MSLDRLLVFQSLWGMQGLRGETTHSRLDDQVARIARAGFDGVTDHFYDPAHAARLMPLLRAHGLTLEGQVFPRTAADLAPALTLAERYGCHHLTLQVMACPSRVSDCRPLLDAWQAMAERSAVPVFIETHRGRMTNDLLFTQHLLDACPALRLTADLSHYVVAREIELPVPAETEAMITRILRHARAFHGRVAGSHQIQLPLHGYPQHAAWRAQFEAWWRQGFMLWRQAAAAGESLSFTCELGPAPYAISGPDGADLTDRWAEALDLAARARALWAEASARPG